VTDRLMTDKLVERVFAWRLAPDRFLTGGRNWIRRSRFRPFNDIRDAIRLADKLTRHYSLTSHPDGFTAEVRFRGRTGRATARNKARAITLAVAQVVDLDVASACPGSRHGGAR
jgi:hypothetical protein